MPKRARQRDPGHVVALIYDRLCTFEFGLCAEVFALSRPELDCPWYSFASVAIEAGPLAAAGGLTIKATGGAEDLARAGIVVIPGWRDVGAPIPKRLIEQLQKAYAEGARILTICSGVFPLAAAGLLDGKSATTHWRYAEALQNAFPKVDVKPDQLYVESGRLTTSAGSAAGIDMLLHTVRQDFGEQVANTVARRLVMHTHRQGGQRQFIAAPVASDYEADRLSPMIDELRESLDKMFSVSSLASSAKMSTRTFQRRFVAMTGMPVGQWLAGERIRVACQLLESTSLPLVTVAARTGLGSVDNLQYHFRKRIGVSPGQYRARFSA